MRIYLDTYQLSLLEQANEPLDGFFAAWRAGGAVLAVSDVHLNEMATTAGGTQQHVDQRIALLGRFPTLAFANSTAEWLAEGEAFVQLMDRAVEGTPFPNGGVIPAELWKVATALHWDLTVDAAGVARIREDLDALLRKIRASNDAVAGRINTFRQQLRRVAGNAYPIRTREDLRSAARSAGIGILQCLDVADLRDLPALRSFVGMVNNVTLPRMRECGVPEARIRDALRYLDPYTLPGISLWFAAARAREDLGRRVRTSDAADWAHLMFACHVDLAFVDTKTYEHLERERGDRPHLLRASVTPRIRAATTIDGILSEMQALAAESA